MTEDILGTDGRIKPELVKQLVADGIERGHKRDYEAALQHAGVDGPSWESLTEVQRHRIRLVNLEERRAMQEFCASLVNRSGQPSFKR